MPFSSKNKFDKIELGTLHLYNIHITMEHNYEPIRAAYKNICLYYFYSEIHYMYMSL